MTAKRVLGLTTLCLIGGGLYAFMLASHQDQSVRLTPDSRVYHMNAVNILLGKGYYSWPTGSLDDYDAETAKLFSPEDVLAPDKRPTMGLPPVYILFLAAIYRAHGISPDTVVPYQIGATALTGVLMVVIGYLMRGMPGALVAIGAIVLLGNNPEAWYPVPQILTECLTTFVLTSSVAAALWAEKGRPRREVVVGLGLSLAALTRPALLFTGLAYGAVHLFWPSSDFRRRALAFGLTCAVLLGSWFVFAWVQAGEVTQAMTRRNTFFNGIRGDWGAKVAAEGRRHEHSERRAGDEIRRVAKDPLAYLAILKGKLKNCLFRMSRTVWNAILLGFALIAMVRRVPHPGGDDHDVAQFLVRPAGLVRGRRCIEWLLLGSAILLGLVALGFSSPLIQFAFLCLAIVAPVFRMEIVPDVGQPAASSPAWPHWMTVWLLGFLLLIWYGPPLPRYMRPFLPTYYLCAAAAIPLLAEALIAVRGGSLGGQSAAVYRWEAEPESPQSAPPDASN